MKTMTISSAILVLMFASVSAAQTTTALVPGSSIQLSTQTPDRGLAAKAKIMRMGNGMLVVVFGDGGSDELVYDTKGDAERFARDLFVTTCNPNAADCGDAASWSTPTNVSETASQTSISTQWRGPDLGTLPYYGDSSKPQIFANGPALVLTWNDAYCPGGDQRTITYLERDERTVPFRCVYTSRSLNNGMTWSTPQQLTSGLRDSTQDVSRGSSAAWIITWQEDPVGLQLGEGDGPGEGASGAHVSHGTDIWYTALARADFDAGDGFPTPVRITDNFTHVGSRGEDPTEYERGREGASRANAALIGPLVIVAYEETRGVESIIDGKNVRYHAFPFTAPPTSCEDDPAAPGSCRMSPWGDAYPNASDPARAGCILSDPGENSRRVRLVFNGSEPTSGTRLFIFWRQGIPTQGGPADIVGRTATGFGLADFRQAVAMPTAVAPGDTLDGCYALGDEDLGTGAYGNAHPLNFSAASTEGGDLTAETFADNIEDARAHRAIISGNFVLMGYTYTPDGIVSTYTDLEHHNFYVRRSTDGGQTWGAPMDLSSPAIAALAADLGLPETGIQLREPRLVKTPGNGPGCTTGDPMDPSTTRASDCRAPGTVIVAWGTQTNVYEHLGGAEDVDIFITRTTNAGMSFEPVQMLANTTLPEMESQLRTTPDGRTVFSVWNDHGPTDNNSLFSIAVEGEVTIVPDPGDAGTGDAGTGDAGIADSGTVDPDAGPTDDAGTTIDAGTEDTGVITAFTSDDGSGCSTAAVGSDSPMHTALTWLSLGALGLILARRNRRR